MPLFITQFFGAFNDNFLKNAIVIMVAYRQLSDSAEIAMVSNLAAGLFILPYFLFSALAGQLADKFDRAPYCRWVKLWEIALMVLAAAGFYFRSAGFLLGVLFFMGMQSTFFGPAKYSLLPTHLREDELLGGNSWIEGGTYIAIMLGITLSGLLVNLPGGTFICSAVLVIFAVAGYLASCFIPSAPAADAGMKTDFNLFCQTWKILYENVWCQVTVRRCVLSVSVFWMAGALLVSQMPPFVKCYLGGSERICTIFFVLFAVGVGIGSGAVNLLLRRSDINMAVIGAVVLMGVFTADFAVMSSVLPPVKELVPDVKLYGSLHFWRSIGDVLMAAICGGIWAVSVQSLMQKSSDKRVLARVIAGNNIVNSLFMAGGAAVTVALLKCGLTLAWIFGIMALFIIASAFYTLKLIGKRL